MYSMTHYDDATITVCSNKTQSITLHSLPQRLINLELHHQYKIIKAKCSTYL